MYIEILDHYFGKKALHNFLRKVSSTDMQLESNKSVWFATNQSSYGTVQWNLVKESLIQDKDSRQDNSAKAECSSENEGP